MNKDRREKFRRWFTGALLPALSKDGIIRYVGTILHMDAMLERLMPEFQLKGNQTFLVKEPLKEYASVTLPWKSIKYRAHDEEMDNVLWRAKFSREDLVRERQFYTQQGLPDVYSQEYLNKPIDDSTAFYKRTDFRYSDREDKQKHLNYYITGDFAISEKERADYTAIVVGGVDEHNILHVRDVIRERMDGREIVDTLINLQNLYNPIVVGIEDGQISKSLGPFLREEMINRNTFLNIQLLKPHKTDKIMRARSMQARMRAGAVKFDKEADWYPILEEEMTKFPRGRNDDQVDAMSYLGLLIDSYMNAQTKEEKMEEEYDREMEESGMNDLGRSQITGY